MNVVWNFTTLSFTFFSGEFKKVKNKELLKKFMSVLAQRTNKDNSNSSSITRFVLRLEDCVIGKHDGIPLDLAFLVIYVNL